MVDTPVPIPTLISPLLADGQPPRSVGVAALRQVVVSLPVDLGYGPYTGVGFPAILRGTLNLASYPGVTVGAGQTTPTRAATAAAIQAASDQAATNNNFLEIPPGIYEIDNTAGITWSDTTKYGGFTVRGSQNSQIVQFHTNAPVLTIGDTSSNASLTMANVDIHGLFLNYGGSQSGNTGAVTLTLGRLWRSRFGGLQIGDGGFAPWTALRMATADASGGQFFFSNTLDDINIQLAQNRLFSCESTGTGNKYSNIYMNNATGPNTAGAITLPFYLGGVLGNNEDQFDRINIEWCSANTMMHFVQGCAQFNTLHLEGLVMTGATPYIVYLEGESIVEMNRPTFLNLGVNTGNYTGQATFAGMFSEESLSMRDPWFVDSANPVTRNGSLLMFFQDTSNSPLVPRAQVQLDGAIFDSWDGFMKLDPTQTQPAYGSIRRISGYNYPKIFPAAKTCQVANPANNQVIPGCLGGETIVKYDTPIAGNVNLVLGANYMLSTDKGSTLKRPVGHQIIVYRAAGCTGNFNIVVRDTTAAGTTLGTFTGTGSINTTQTFGWNGTAWAAI